MIMLSEEVFYLVWCYVMIEDGVIRLYLGIRVKDDYDYKFRLWWVIIN